MEKSGEVHIEPFFWCDYGYNISVGENFYANHGLVILDAVGNPCKVIREITEKDKMTNWNR